MKPRNRSLLVLLLLVAASFLLPAVHWRVIGWVRGEAFYQGRPTSYWQIECQRWDYVPPFLGPQHYRRDQTWWERLGGRWNFGASVFVLNPPFSEADPESLPVLLKLLAVDDAHCQHPAMTGFSALGDRAQSALAQLETFCQRPSHGKDRVLRYHSAVTVNAIAPDAVATECTQ